MAGESYEAPSGADEVVRLVPVFALAVAVVAVAVDPSSAVDLVFVVLPVAAFGLWVYVPHVPLTAVSFAVVVPVVVAQRSGQLEPLMFELSLLAFVVGRWSKSLATAAALGLLAAASPVVVSVIQDPSEINVGIWILGVAFPWAIGRALARQAQLAAQLDATRHELAQQALLSERRRIARDVHDFVGHGLAALMLQVTSARHVLRRDPAAAEEALRSAEEVGRRSMQELRRTVSLLRSEDEVGVASSLRVGESRRRHSSGGVEDRLKAVEGLAPLPSAMEIPALVDQARTGGLAVELRTRGDLSRIPPGVGVALYRIAQEALANVARHAPRARTVLALELEDGQVRLVAESNGPAVTTTAAEPERPRYGLLGMQERAAAIGGELAAGPTRDGWRVMCRLPLEPQDEHPDGGSGSR